MNKSKKRGVCVYCGKIGHITRDHIPPKSLFKSPRPELIIINACDICHSSTSKDDEYFRAVLSIRNTSNSPDAVAARDSFIRSLRRPAQRGFRKSFLSRIRELNLRTPAGLFLGKHGVYDVDLERLDRVVSRIIRGLYFHYFQKPLPGESSVSSWNEDGLFDLDKSARDTLTEILGPLTKTQEYRIGDGTTFRYRFLSADREFASAWLITIYENTKFLGITVLEDNNI